MNIVTSVTAFNDAVGKRLSITYSVIDESTGKVISDNNRTDRVITDSNIKALMNELEDYAQSVISALEG